MITTLKWKSSEEFPKQTLSKLSKIKKFHLLKQMELFYLHPFLNSYYPIYPHRHKQKRSNRP